MTDFIHLFKPPTRPGGPILLLLHGTGGDENDLVPLAEVLLPEAGVLSPRGKVLERGMPRFFRRLAEGVFDIEDLKFRAAELADFISETAATHNFSTRDLTAVGFSNGANIAGALLLLRPDALGAAVMFRAMVPLVPEQLPRLAHTPALISNGRLDPLVSAEETEQLASLLRSAGADVTVSWQNSGHELTERDVVTAREWLAQRRMR
ncbi:MAG TPA: alpha/beta hydrolase [Vicinamibacterales bacterium]|nr:alpha/beta hydrolase [Vicinamibacterales bacterium]